jgi:hypothetical protein
LTKREAGIWDTENGSGSRQRVVYEEGKVTVVTVVVVVIVVTFMTANKYL